MSVTGGLSSNDSLKDVRHICPRVRVHAECRARRKRHANLYDLAPAGIKRQPARRTGNHPVLGDGQPRNAGYNPPAIDAFFADLIQTANDGSGNTGGSNFFFLLYFPWPARMNYPISMDDSTLSDLIDESIVMLDRSGRILYWNGASERLYGWTREQAIGRQATELLAMVENPSADESLSEAWSRGRGAGEVRRRSADGSERVIEARWTVHHGRDGTPPTLIEVGRDVTQRNASREALAHSEYRYRNLFNAMAASFWVIDFTGVGRRLKALRAEGARDFSVLLGRDLNLVRELMRATRVLDVNDLTVELFGLDGSKASLLRDLEPFWPEESSAVFANAVIASVSGKRSFVTETRLRSLAGHEFDVLFTASFAPESVARGELLVGVIDISQRTKVQVELQQLQANFAHAARVSVLGELTASIAHEVNQPLAAIATNGEAGLRWLDRPVPALDEVRQLMGRMVADTRRAADIITRIRSLAMRRPTEKRALDLHELVRETEAFLRQELALHHVSLQLELDSGLPAVMADRTQLQQVLVNLIVNAIQAFPAQRGSPARIRIRAAADGHGMVQVAVEDSGPGVQGQVDAKLFESFYSTKPDGMGMGLAICRSILEEHGGGIEVTASRELGGACFVARVPASAAPA